MRNFQGIVFIWTQTYSEMFKSALVYLSENEKNRQKKNVKKWRARKKKNTKNQVTMKIFSFTFYVKNYILLKNSVKKVVSVILFTVFMRCRYLKRCNDASKLNIHKCNNYN